GQVPGLSAAPGVYRSSHPRLGQSGLPQRRHRLSGLQEAGDRRHLRRTGPDPAAGRGGRRQYGCGAPDPQRRCRARPRCVPRHPQRTAPGHGPELPPRLMSTREPEQLSAAAPTAAPPVAPAPVQHELPLAIVNGQPLTELPQDLYIPPQALEVFLDAFEGPLDLLLYLIRRQNLDILDIPVAQITHQYMGYVELMKAVRLELAAEYLVMAAMLAEIKSRMLLPRQETQGDEEEDPRAELIRRLQEYER